MGDATSFDDDAELHRLRRENSELRARVAHLESSSSASRSMASLTLDGAPHASHRRTYGGMGRTDAPPPTAATCDIAPPAPLTAARMGPQRAARI